MVERLKFGFRIIGREVSKRMIQIERLAEDPEIYKGYAEIFHNRMIKYNLLDVVFYDSDEIIRADHIERLLLSGSPYIIRLKSELIGFIVLTNRRLYRAEITFYTWPPYWGRGSVDRGKAILKQLISMRENKSLLNLYGFSSASNKAIKRYAEKIGFQNPVVMGITSNSVAFRYYNIERD